MNTAILVFFVLATVVVFVYGLKKSNVGKTTVIMTEGLMRILTTKPPCDCEKEDPK